MKIDSVMEIVAVVIAVINSCDSSYRRGKVVVVVVMVVVGVVMVVVGVVM